jgi:hypothetical protein
MPRLLISPLVSSTVQLSTATSQIGHKGRRGAIDRHAYHWVQWQPDFKLTGAVRRLVCVLQ